MNATVRLALGDLRERVRRPSYAVTLLASAALAYLAVPAADGQWTVVDAGGYRGVYDMAYVGAVVALGGALWLALGGFYVVRGAIASDRTSGVGRILATTPVRSASYLAGKLLSNTAILGSMVAVLVVVALVMWWAREEDPTIDPMGLLTPFVVVTLPVVVMVAAVALLFDTVPGLRGGLGTVLWLPIWMVTAVGGQNGLAPLGGVGVQALASPFADSLDRAGATVDHGFSLGFTKVEEPLTPIAWDGLALDSAFLADRALLVCGAIAVALLPALWFRTRATDPVNARWRWLPLGSGSIVRGPMPPTLVLAELRILLSGVSVWWWSGATALCLAGLVLPADTVRAAVLPGCWIWPTLLWSRIGTAHIGVGMEGVLASYPRPALRQAAAWAAGVILAAVVAVVPLVRLLAAGETTAVAAWCGAAVFVPALAAALGTIGRTPTLFQALYPMLWYLAVNGIAAVDFMGVSAPDLAHAATVGLLGALLLAVTLLAGQIRRLRT